MKLFGLEEEKKKSFPIQRKSDERKSNFVGNVYDVRNPVCFIYIGKQLWAADPIAVMLSHNRK